MGLPGEVDREHSDCSLRMRGQDKGSARIKVYILVLYIVQCACTVGGSKYVIMGSIVFYSRLDYMQETDRYNILLQEQH